MLGEVTYQQFLITFFTFYYFLNLIHASASIWAQANF